MRKRGGWEKLCSEASLPARKQRHEPPTRSHRAPVAPASDHRSARSCKHILGLLWCRCGWLAEQAGPV